MLKELENRRTFLITSIWVVISSGIFFPSFIDNSLPINSYGTTGIVAFFILIPGTFFGLVVLQLKNFFASMWIGTAVLISLIIPIHAYFSKLGVAWILYLIIFFVTLFFLLRINKYSSTKDLVFKIEINLKNIIILIFLIIIYFLLVRQSLYVPSNNLDQFLVWPDTYNAIAQAGEITNHGPSIFPFVADAQVPLKYHWGAFSLGSFISFFGNFDLVVSIFKTQFVLLGIIYFGLLYITGKSIGKSWIAGVFSLILGGLTIYPNFPEFNENIGLARPFITSTSMPQFTANIFAILAVYIIYNVNNIKINNIMKFILVFFTTISATLSKGPVGLLIVILAISFLIFNYKLILKINKIVLVIPTILGFLIGYSQITSSNSKLGRNGTSLWLNPLDTFKLISDGYGIDLSWISLSIFILLFIFSFIFLLFAVIFSLEKGIFRLVFPLIITSLAGILGSILFETWGDSQLFLMYSAIPFIGVLLPSTAFFKSDSIDSITIFIITLGLVGQPLIFNLISSLVPRSQILKTFAIWAFSVLLVIILSSVVAKILSRNISHLILIVSFSIGMLSGLNKFDQKAYALPEHPYSISIGTYDLAKYLKNISTKDDLIATNRHCAGYEENQTCTARQFALSAISERRVFIEGWSYTTCPLQDPIQNKYWREDAWKVNQEFFMNPNNSNFEILKRAGVDWLFVDSTRPSVNNYEGYAQLIKKIGSVALWKITDPYKGKIQKQIDACGPNSVHLIK